MKEESGDGGRQRDALPARLAIQHGRERRDAGNSVKNSRDSQPEQGHMRGNYSVYRRAADGLYRMQNGYSG
jgi:hypothetical protein